MSVSVCESVSVRESVSVCDVSVSSNEIAQINQSQFAREILIFIAQWLHERPQPKIMSAVSIQNTSYFIQH